MGYHGIWSSRAADSCLSRCRRSTGFVRTAEDMVGSPFATDVRSTDELDEDDEELDLEPTLHSQKTMVENLNS